MKRIILLIMLAALMIGVQAKKKSPVPVYIVAGQSNTDGRVLNEYLPDYIKENKYQHCYWSYGSGGHSGEGRFELFWPRIVNQNKPGRWTYDAVVYYWLEQSLGCDFYVIKESLGGTSIDTSVRSNQNMYWSASPEYLASTTASDKGGKSLLKAFTENIGACIDNVLSRQKDDYEIKAFLWHQGESDRQVSRLYYDNLKAVVAYVRNYLVEKTGDKRYAHLPVIVGSIVHEGRGYASGLEEAQMRLQREDKDFHLVDVHDAGLQGDNIHFNPAGAELLGRKMYNQLATLGLAGQWAQPVPFTQRSRRIEVSGDGEAFLWAYLPDSIASEGRSIVACPGGAYSHLSMADEGTNWADFFNRQGIAYFTLVYRMPQGDRTRPIGDAERAIRIVRDSCAAWGLNPRQVGIMGSSAGGHLASTVATHADSLSRPDFQILFYPVITTGEGRHEGSIKSLLGSDAANTDVLRQYSNEQQVRQGVTPPALILLADDDRSVPPLQNGVAYYEALHRVGVPAALHVYPSGGHGFGFKKSFTYHDQLLTDIAAWLQNLLKNDSLKR